MTVNYSSYPYINLLISSGHQLKHHHHCRQCLDWEIRLPIVWLEQNVVFIQDQWYYEWIQYCTGCSRQAGIREPVEDDMCDSSSTYEWNLIKAPVLDVEAFISHSSGTLSAVTRQHVYWMALDSYI